MSPKWTVSCSLLLLAVAFVNSEIRSNDGSREAAAISGIQAALGAQLRKIRSARNTVNNLDKDLAYQMRQATCESGISSQNCPTAETDQAQQQWQILNSGRNPGRRYTEEELAEKSGNLGILSRKEILDLILSLAKKRRDLAKIHELLNDNEDRIVRQSKRTCRVELGGACRTEWASAIADQYYYLMSPHSPGKRKRRSPFNVIQTKIAKILKKHN